MTYMILKSALDLSLLYLNCVAGATFLLLGIQYFLEKPRDTFEGVYGHVYDDFEEGEHECEHEYLEIIRDTHSHRHAMKILISRWVRVSSWV